MSIDRRSLLAAGVAPLLTRHFQEGQRVTAAPISIVELRQYTLRKHRRDELIDLFERAFVAPQNEVGAHVLGAFRDLDDADRFVWLRGFEDMAHRADALTAFYGGPVWQAHRDAANATMLDSDNVLLLETVGDLTWRPARRLGEGMGLVTAEIHYLGGVDPALFETFFGATMAPMMERDGARPLGRLVTANVENNFPRLPIRQGERALVALWGWRDERHAATSRARVASASGWRDGAPNAVLPALMRKPENLRLAPVAVARSIGA